MKVTKYEIKKVFSRTGSKIVLLIILAIVIMECNLALDADYVDENGNSIHGITAIKPLREEQLKWSGELTEERIAEVIGRLNEIQSMPEAALKTVKDDNITYHRRQGLSGIRNLLNYSYSSSFRDYDYFVADTLSKEQASSFYDNRIKLLKAWLYGEADGFYTEKEKEFLLTKFEQIKTPFYYTYNRGWSQLLYISPIVINALALFICCLVSGIFSNEFAWKADSIYFSAYHGRNTAILAKIKAGLCIVISVYLTAIFLFTAIVLLVMGANGAGCPIQTTDGGWKCFYNITTLKYYLVVVLGGLVGCLVMGILTMLISAKTKSTVVAVIVPFIVMFLPPVFLSNIKSDTVTKIRGLFPDSILSMEQTMRTYNLYNVFGKVVHSVPLLFVIYGVSAVVLPFVVYRIYKGIRD